MKKPRAGEQRLPFPETERWPEPHILLSLHPEYPQAMLRGIKKYEYRRGQFIATAASAFVYATIAKSPADRGLPTASLLAIARLGEPILGVEVAMSIREGQEPGSRPKMEAWLAGYTQASTHPVLDIQALPDPISLNEIRDHFPTFHPPQKYLVLANNPPLLNFLKTRSGLFE